MAYIIETQALTKRYGQKQAVDQMSLHVEKGDIYGIIGKNGAGKTTLMKMLVGLTKPTDGSIKLFGGDQLNQARRRIGSLIEAPAFYKRESALENLRRFALLTPTPEEELHRLLELVGLADVGNKKAGTFSLGMKQRLGIAIALLGDPELLVLDEPINGLDPAGIKHIRDLLLELNAKGVTLLISSHLLDELGKIATRYGILSDGVLVEEISAQELEEKCRACLKLVTDNGEKAAEALRAAGMELRLEVADNVLHIYSDTDSSEINRVLVSAGIRVYSLQDVSIGFEDFFIERLGE